MYHMIFAAGLARVIIMFRCGCLVTHLFQTYLVIVYAQELTKDSKPLCDM